MNADRKSDESVVPATSANNGVAEVRFEAARRENASDRVRSLCDRTPQTTRRGPAGSFRLSGLHAQVCPDAEAGLVHHPSSFHGETRACDPAGDQSETAKANAPPARRNGSLAATRCARLAELSCRPEQQSPHRPLRGRGDSSLVVGHPPPQPTWSTSLDVGSDATSCETPSPPSAHYPPLSQPTISRSTQGRSRMR